MHYWLPALYRPHAFQSVFQTKFPHLDKVSTWAGLIKGLAQSRHSSSGFHSRHPSHATVSSWKGQRSFQALPANIRLLHWLPYSPKNSLFTLNTFKQPATLHDKGNSKRKILSACIRMHGRCSKALDGLISSHLHRINKHLVTDGDQFSLLKKKKKVKLNFVILMGKIFISFQRFAVRKLHFYLQSILQREIKPLRITESTTALVWIHGPNQQQSQGKKKAFTSCSSSDSH